MLERNDIWQNKVMRGFVTFFPLLLMLCTVIILSRKADEAAVARRPVRSFADSLFEFDPNTVTYREMILLGIPRKAAAEVSLRQARGWAFEVPEQFGALYGMTDSIYFMLEPYIVIGEEFRAKPRPRAQPYQRRQPPKIVYRPFRIDTATVAYLSTIGFSRRQAEVITDYRDRCGGLYSIEEFARCYVVDSKICDTLSYYIIFPDREEDASAVTFPIDINTADSATLRKVWGIGEKSVMKIIEYREKLGGFIRPDQLAELKLVTESNFEKILPQIYCDTCNISKIDINFASPTQLNGHPYITPRKLRKLLSKRQLKGGWSRIEEMIDDGIFDEKDAEKLRPYLRFAGESE